jgi:hypothetical protein
MSISSQQNLRQTRIITTANKSPENVGSLKSWNHSGKSHLHQGQTKGRLMSAAFQTITFCIPSCYMHTYTNRTCKTCRNINFSCRFIWVWDLVSQIGLMVPDSRVLGKIVDTKAETKIKRRKLHTDEFVNYTIYARRPILLTWSSQGELDG